MHLCLMGQRQLGENNQSSHIPIMSSEAFFSF